MTIFLNATFISIFPDVRHAFNIRADEQTSVLLFRVMKDGRFQHWGYISSEFLHGCLSDSYLAPLRDFTTHII